MSITVRPARAEEQARIKQIIYRARINPLDLDWRRFLVADEDGEIVGVGQVRPHFDGSRELASIAVIPSHRSRGIASQVILALLAREPGVLYLTCRPQLRAFYERFGFRPIAFDEMPPTFRRWYRFVKWLGKMSGVVVMQRASSQSPAQDLTQPNGLL